MSKQPRWTTNYSSPLESVDSPFSINETEGLNQQQEKGLNPMKRELKIDPETSATTGILHRVRKKVLSWWPWSTPIRHKAEPFSRGDLSKQESYSNQSRTDTVQPTVPDDQGSLDRHIQYDNHLLKQDVLNTVIPLVKKWSLFIAFVIVCQGYTHTPSNPYGMGFKLDVLTVNLLIGATTAKFLGLLYAIVKHFFENKDAKGENGTKNEQSKN